MSEHEKKTEEQQRENSPSDLRDAEPVSDAPDTEIFGAESGETTPRSNAISSAAEEGYAASADGDVEESDEDDEEINEEDDEETNDEGAPRRRICSLCFRPFFAASADVLTVGGYGTPRYLCPECSMLFEQATRSGDPLRITEACREIGETMTRVNNEDELVLTTVNDLLAAAIERKRKIEDGSYNFADDEAEDEGEDFPEELLESEEDRARDRADEEREKKIDRIWSYISGGVIAAVVIFLIFYYLF